MGLTRTGGGQYVSRSVVHALVGWEAGVSMANPRPGRHYHMDEAQQSAADRATPHYAAPLYTT